MDIFSKRKRSEIMSGIRSGNTREEIVVRKILHGMGFRFRLHRRDLPGCPDIVLRRHKTVVFVHGCFWHRHSGCSNARLPANNQNYWLPKLRNNVTRFRRQQTDLEEMGWKVVVIWGCQARNQFELVRLLAKLLVRPGP